MAWLALLGAGLFEVVGVNGFQQLSLRRYKHGLPLTIAGFGAALALLHLATQSLSLTVAYAVFTAIGTLGGVTMGILLWNERLSMARIFWVGVVVVAIIGLKVSNH